MDEAKLPKWARDQMESLRREVERLRTDRDTLIAGGDAASCRGFWLEESLEKGADYALPMNRRSLNFRGSTGDLRISHEEDRASGITWLNINAETGGLIVRPHVRNVVHVRALTNKELY